MMNLRDTLISFSVLTALLCFATGCDRGEADVAPAKPQASETSTAGNTETASAGESSSSDPSGGSLLEFDRSVHDFGVITDTDTYRTSFRFTNAGDETLRIEDIKAACGCTTPSLQKYVYQPGEGGEIEIVFDPKGKTDHQRRFLTVLSNSRDSPTTRVSIEADVTPLVRIEPKFLKFGDLTLGETYKQTLQLTHRDPDLQIENLSINNEHLSAEVIESNVQMPGRDNAQYRTTIEVSVEKEIPWGTIYATRLSFTAVGSLAEDGETVRKGYTTYITGKVFGELIATPSPLISVGIINPGEQFQGSVMLQHRLSEPFEIQNAVIEQSPLPGLEARVEPAGTGRYQLLLTGLADRPGPMRGTIQVTTTLPPPEDEITVRFAGNVKAR